MRLIDADILISNLEHTCYKFSADSPCHDAAKSLIRLLEIQPTIDAEPVVRCKDCDKSEPSNVWDGWIFCHANKIHQKDDNFCSYGERRDSNG